VEDRWRILVMTRGNKTLPTQQRKGGNYTCHTCENRQATKKEKTRPQKKQNKKGGKIIIIIIIIIIIDL
jgi:hypothetical protein